MLRSYLIVCFSLCFLLVSAQDTITLEGIWKDGTYAHNRVPGFTFMEDGKHYTKRVDDSVVKYDLTTGEKVETLWDGQSYKGKAGFDGKFATYEFVNNEQYILITDNIKSIYRHSFKADYFIYDRTLDKLARVYKDPVQYATISPSGEHMAFVYENDLYVKTMASGGVVRITTDGKKNLIINGAADWVYEEEFAFEKAFFWNTDGSSLAYMRFDESAVKEFTMTMHYDQMYPQYETFKYPKVGETNATVTTHIYNLASEKTVQVDLAADPEMYTPRLKWTQDPSELCVFYMNRHQNRLNLFIANRKNGKVKKLMEETNQYYIDITDNLTFLEDGKHFIWTSEQSGFNHIYLYDMKGKLVKPLTSGDYDVLSFLGMDKVNGDIYYQAADISPQQKHVYRLNIDSGKKTPMTDFKGTNYTQFSSTYDYYVNTNSTFESAPTYKVYDRDRNVVRIIEDNASVASIQQAHNTVSAEFFDFTTDYGVTLNGYMIKPQNFDPNQEYPVFMYLYGGPGSQQVVDSWKGSYYWWFQMLAAQGYVVACVDNRGTGSRGEEFKKMTYQQLGKYETEDQIAAAKYLGELPFTDGSRIGIFGWSYGGYMSSLCLLKGNDVFKSAIAVAPVTNWKWYDTIYTERYMRTYVENKEGYDENSPIHFADRLKGNYLLVHGMADDNVHFQHTAEMAAALIKANKQFDTYFYPNRNHGIYGDNARLHLWTKMTNFILEKI